MPAQKADDDEQKREGEETAVLPEFTQGETGPHKPAVAKKFTQPPKPFTEATLLRAMETAGKNVDDEALRDALKENGIGRPSTRAAIIETLYRRRYIAKQRKSIYPTPTGRELIATIHYDLLKSPELTGQWEKKLREIERGEYDAARFVAELKEMVGGIVASVIAERDTHRVAAGISEAPKRGRAASKRAAGGKKGGGKASGTAVASAATGVSSPASAAPSPAPVAASHVREGDVCPLCGKGTIIRGHTALGCSRWREGCTFRAPLPER